MSTKEESSGATRGAASAAPASPSHGNAGGGMGWATALILALSSNCLFGQILYVGNSGNNTISAYVIDQESGFLTELLRVATPGNPTSVAVHPSGKFAYVTTAGTPGVSAFSINSGTGALTLLSSLPMPPGTNPQGAVVDASGKFLFVANQGVGNVSVFSIDASTGALSPVPGSPFAAPQGPNKVVVHPNGKFAFVSAVGASQIAAFNIGADGALTPAAGSPFPARNNLFWMAMDPAGKFLFAVERQDNAVLVYSIDATTGALTQVGSPFPASGGVTGVAVDPAGKFLYVSNFGGSATVFSIGATGALTRRSDIGTISGSFDAIMDPTGKFVYFPGQQANSIRGFAIDASSGALTPLPQQFVPAGVQPQRGASILLTPPVLPPNSAGSAVNYHSRALAGMPNSAIAQGSRLAITGKNIGPASEVGSDFPLQTELGGASIQIQSGDVITAALMVFASNGLVTGVVPSTTPLGDAMVTVTYKDRTTAPLPITIVTASVGIRTLNDFGSGPAKAWTAPADTVLPPDESILQPTNLSRSAKPGQLVFVQATGLGPATFDETQDLSQELSVLVDVIVGNKITAAIYELRVAQGSDFIGFKLPLDAPEGCYVPLAIRAGGVVSNVTSISISSTGTTCSDPVTGLSASDIDLAQASNNLRMGMIVINHFDLFDDGNISASFPRYSFPDLLTSLSPGGRIRLIDVGYPPLGSCTVTAGAPTDVNNFIHLPDDPNFPTSGNAANTLNFGLPSGSLQVQGPPYDAHLPALPPGNYTVDNGAGTQAVGPFKATLVVPQPIQWTNVDSINSVPLSQDLTITWSGGDSTKEYVVIVGLSAGVQATSGFLCTERVSAGQFTVPAWVTSTMSASSTFMNDGQVAPGGLIGLGTTSITTSARFAASGLDAGFFMYEQISLKLAPFQ